MSLVGGARPFPIAPSSINPGVLADINPAILADRLQQDGIEPAIVDENGEQMTNGGDIDEQLAELEQDLEEFE